MASKDMGLLQAQKRLDNGLNHHHHHHHPQLVFPDNSFSCVPPPPPRRPTTVSADHTSKTATRELTSGFIDHNRYFHQPSPTDDFRRAAFPSPSSAATSHQDNCLNWNLSSHTSTTPSGADGSDDDNDDEDGPEDDDDDDDEDEVEGLADSNDTINKSKRVKLASQKMKQLSSFGLKEGDVVGRSGNDEDNSNNGEMRNAVTIADADGDMYYSHYLQGATAEVVGPNSSRQKDVSVVDNNGCGFSGRKELLESGDSLREILSDPLTGALMDDAMILPCGHSFGSGGIQHVLRMKSCYTCSQTVSEDSVSPNLSLRLAVKAFCREEELQVHRASKRRKERLEQTDHPRGRGVQFPFSVTDRVIIKGNKRTPPRFVGREAIVTTQCLNGWYVVKTLDNAESVKLQYRSLARVADNPSPKPIASKTTPNWL